MEAFLMGHSSMTAMFQASNSSQSRQEWEGVGWEGGLQSTGNQWLVYAGGENFLLPSRFCGWPKNETDIRQSNRRKICKLILLCVHGSLQKKKEDPKKPVCPKACILIQSKRNCGDCNKTKGQSTMGQWLGYMAKWDELMKAKDYFSNFVCVGPSWW